VGIFGVGGGVEVSYSNDRNNVSEDQRKEKIKEEEEEKK